MASGGNPWLVPLVVLQLEMPPSSPNSVLVSLFLRMPVSAPLPTISCPGLLQGAQELGLPWPRSFLSSWAKVSVNPSPSLELLVANIFDTQLMTIRAWEDETGGLLGVPGLVYRVRLYSKQTRSCRRCLAETHLTPCKVSTWHRVCVWRGVTQPWRSWLSGPSSSS